MKSIANDDPRTRHPSFFFAMSFNVDSITCCCCCCSCWWYTTDQQTSRSSHWSIRQDTEKTSPPFYVLLYRSQWRLSVWLQRCGRLRPFLPWSLLCIPFKVTVRDLLSPRRRPVKDRTGIIILFCVIWLITMLKYLRLRPENGPVVILSWSICNLQKRTMQPPTKTLRRNDEACERGDLYRQRHYPLCLLTVWVIPVLTKVCNTLLTRRVTC